MNNLENLIGKKVMFRETDKKTNIFYYDATIKKIGYTFFLKFNQPDLRIFDFYSLGEAKKPKTNLATARLLFHRIAELDKDKKQNVYKKIFVSLVSKTLLLNCPLNIRKKQRRQNEKKKRK